LDKILPQNMLNHHLQYEPAGSNNVQEYGIQKGMLQHWRSSKASICEL